MNVWLIVREAGEGHADREWQPIEVHMREDTARNSAARYNAKANPQYESYEVHAVPWAGIGQIVIGTTK